MRDDLRFLSAETVANMYEKFRDAQEQMIENVDNIHVCVSNKDGKLGPLVWNVSLLPYVDCPACAMRGMCCFICYDSPLLNFRPSLMYARARNSAIHKVDRERFWNEVKEAIRKNFIQALRVNVGGDIDKEDLPYIDEISRDYCEVLMFTECHDEIIEYDRAVGGIDLTRWHVMRSAGTEELKEDSDLPACYISSKKHSNFLPKKNCVDCVNHNCSKCFIEHSGCFGLQRGDNMILPAH